MHIMEPQFNITRHLEIEHHKRPDKTATVPKYHLARINHWPAAGVLTILLTRQSEITALTKPISKRCDQCRFDFVLLLPAHADSISGSAPSVDVCRWHQCAAPACLYIPSPDIIALRKYWHPGILFHLFATRTAAVRKTHQQQQSYNTSAPSRVLITPVCRNPVPIMPHHPMMSQQQ